ncbi:MAG: OmpA family protein [Proteobacteria bacterium]|nr:OmpA family protein [Pseudomonadota bacterium]MBU1059640.1 OmpA family protein [Pseudomonadota bacterium]
MKQLQTFLLILLVGITFGCALKGQVFSVDSNHQELLKNGYQQKVDNFLVIFDGSSSMWDMNDGDTKFNQAKNILLGMNQGIRDLTLNGGLHIIGDTTTTKGTLENDSLIYGMTDYNSAAFAKAVNTLEINGLTPISIPLVKSIKTLEESSGKTAVIVISDGLQVSADKTSPADAAAQLKAVYGDRICIYTILIGNATEGQNTMAAVAKAGECGFATTGNAVANTAGMNDFIEKVFFEKVAPPVSFNLHVKFDFDKDTIRPDAQDNLDEVGSFLATHTQITVTLEGHTCSMGSDKYNQNLSQRRAESVKRYLSQKFSIESSRLTATGYGESRPMASNDTEEGRKQNRRVMATITNDRK